MCLLCKKALSLSFSGCKDIIFCHLKKSLSIGNFYNFTNYTL